MRLGDLKSKIKRVSKNVYFLHISSQRFQNFNHKYDDTQNFIVLPISIKLMNDRSNILD